MSESEPTTVFDLAGGEEAFVELIDRFYARVESDEVLRPIYPDDLEPGKAHLARFFMQYWGAGPVYSQERGHPRLRMRHAPFAITREAALRWAQHMGAAVRSMAFDPRVEAAMLDYVARFTPSMINQPDARAAERLPER